MVGFGAWLIDYVRHRFCIFGVIQSRFFVIPKVLVWILELLWRFLDVIVIMAFFIYIVAAAVEPERVYQILLFSFDERHACYWKLETSIMDVLCVYSQAIFSSAESFLGHLGSIWTILSIF